MKYAFAGDRQISCDVLSMLIKKGFHPSALMVTEGTNATHDQELIKISGLDESLILKGKDAIKQADNVAMLQSLNVDYIIGIHYPYIIKPELLAVPKIGFLNLHPAFLPYNKGWHTPSWAIMDHSVYGATLHFMSGSLDEGDIIHQKKVEVRSYDTAHTLYQRVLKAEVEVFEEALDDLVSLKPRRIPQAFEGTSRKKKDLEQVRKFELNDQIIVRDFLDRLRALTTNRREELAYYEDNGKQIGVKIEFVELN